ncbi:uncharacterized protein BKA78DRAFT_307414 [Phyllosticta capitalensis]|uniref:uncharacterized protein n=1 Tax=Phyllosticta capitalensis TaxID=121624 RepID=UPI00312F0F15
MVVCLPAAQTLLAFVNVETGHGVECPRTSVAVGNGGAGSPSKFRVAPSLIRRLYSFTLGAEKIVPTSPSGLAPSLSASG